jgi:hypothetical protein
MVQMVSMAHHELRITYDTHFDCFQYGAGKQFPTGAAMVLTCMDPSDEFAASAWPDAAPQVHATFAQDEVCPSQIASKTYMCARETQLIAVFFDVTLVHAARLSDPW